MKRIIQQIWKELNKQWQLLRHFVVAKKYLIFWYHLKIANKNVISKSTERLFRLSLFGLVILTSFNILFDSIDIYRFNKNEILGILISVISIIIAIIVTYIFSKLFSEKTIKVQRKKEIDKLSKKLTNLRRIAFYISTMHKFWDFDGKSIKNAVDGNYPDLTFEEYESSYYQGNKLTYDEWVKINEAISSTSGKAYLGIKGLIDGDSGFKMFGKFDPRNYSLKDLSRFREYANSFWYLFDRSDNHIVNFNGVPIFWLTKLDDLYFKITGRDIDIANRKNDFKELFSEFESVNFQKHYYLTRLNTDYFSSFYSSLWNLLIFILILICSLFTIVSSANSLWTILFTLLLISLFIANTIDLIIITVASIYNEQKVEEIFEL